MEASASGCICIRLHLHPAGSLLVFSLKAPHNNAATRGNLFTNISANSHVTADD